MLYREVTELGLDRSYVTFVRELRRLGLRPRCEACRTGGHGQSFAHLVEALDGVLRRLGGTPRAWRTDRMATVVVPGFDRLTAPFAQVAKHYGVEV